MEDRAAQVDDRADRVVRVRDRLRGQRVDRRDRQLPSRREAHLAVGQRRVHDRRDEVGVAVAVLVDAAVEAVARLARLVVRAERALEPHGHARVVQLDHRPRVRVELLEDGRRPLGSLHDAVAVDIVEVVAVARVLLLEAGAEGVAVLGQQLGRVEEVGRELHHLLHRHRRRQHRVAPVAAARRGRCLHATRDRRGGLVVERPLARDDSGLRALVRRRRGRPRRPAVGLLRRSAARGRTRGRTRGRARAPEGLAGQDGPRRRQCLLLDASDRRLLHLVELRSVERLVHARRPRQLQALPLVGVWRQVEHVCRGILVERIQDKHEDVALPRALGVHRRGAALLILDGQVAPGHGKQRLDRFLLRGEDGPVQRGVGARVGRVDVRTSLEELLHRLEVPVGRRHHQRGGAVGVSTIDRRARGQSRAYLIEVARSATVDQVVDQLVHQWCGASARPPVCPSPVAVRVRKRGALPTHRVYRSPLRKINSILSIIGQSAQRTAQRSGLRGCARN